MNLQIVSNTIGVINENKTNNFEMKLIESINALNNKTQVEVLNVCYPSTTKNVLENTCFIDLKIEFNNFKKTLGVPSQVLQQAQSTPNIQDQWYYDGVSKLNVTTKRINIPEGIYDLERLLKYINDAYDEYDIFLSFEKNGKIKININLNVEYWLLQTTATYAIHPGLAHDGQTLNKFRMSSSSFGTQKQFEVNVNFDMSEKLAFMLGFKKKEQTFTIGDHSFASIFADYLPDVSDGLNKIYIYCDEIEDSLVGDTTAKLLTTIPIQWSRQGAGNGELICYAPVKSIKKFKKAIIHTLHISLRDTKGDLIPFDSGSITIDCLIHNVES